MSSAGPPAAVRRHCSRPLWWALFGAAAVSGVFVAEMRGIRADERELERDGLRLTGTVADSYRSGAAVPVRYHNPVTDQSVTVDVYVAQGELIPDGPGEAVALLVHPDDPDIASIAGDRTAWPHEAGFYGVVVPALLGLWAARRLGFARAVRLARGDTPTFAMFGVLFARGFGRGCDLHLYPLDAPPGAAPVCAVPVLTTGGIAVDTAFPVEVKGVPRPLGRVVARVGDEVLWPAGRARPRAGSARPTALAPAPVWAPVAVEPPSADAAPASSWTAVLRRELLLFGAGLAAAGAVTGVTLVHAADARELERDGTRVVATVVEHAGTDDRLVLRYRLPGEDREQRGQAPVEFASEWKIGRHYPAVVNLDHPSRLRMAGEPYNVAGPVGWVAPVPVAALLFALAGVRSRRRQVRLARRGPWRTACVWVLETGVLSSTVAIGRHLGAPAAVLRLGTGDANRISTQHGAGAELKLAGVPAPGEDVVLADADRLYLAAGRASAPSTE